MKILVAEDDLNIRNGLIEVLEKEGYTTLSARDGKEALQQYLDKAPDLICLDIMMPGMNGYDVCKEIRRRDPQVPVLFISAKSEEIDKVIGLELGADDFIMKPFGVREVIARIRAVTRRCLATRPTGRPAVSFKMLDIEVFPLELRAKRGEEIIDLSLRDISVLELLHENRGKVVDRDLFFDRCWGMDYIPSSRALDQHISQLRKRIEVDPHDPRIIRTVHGVGYRYEE